VNPAHRRGVLHQEFDANQRDDDEGPAQQLHPREPDQVDRQQGGNRAEYERGRQAVAERQFLLAQGKPQNHRCDNERVVRAQEDFEGDEQTNSFTTSLSWNAIPQTDLDTMRIRVLHWIDGDFRMETTLYFISTAARLLHMHPQTLRKYERLGLVRPSRTVGSMRVYSRDELDRLRLIKHLVDEAGINLAGVQRLLSIAESVQRLRPLLTQDTGRADSRRRIALELKRISETIGL
jgi:MerR family transcriptional regulator, heat shock protein HspR